MKKTDKPFRSVAAIILLCLCTTTSSFQIASQKRYQLPDRLASPPRDRFYGPFKPSPSQHLLSRQSPQLHRSLRSGSVQLSSFPATNESFYLTRVIFLRALAFVYGVAFLVAKHQAKALIGDNGIVPARQILDEAQARGEAKAERRQEWLESNSTSSMRSPVLTAENKWNFYLRLQKIPAVHKIWMQIIKSRRYQYWKERLWDRQDARGFPVTTLLWLAKDRSKLNPWLDGISNWGLAMSIVVLITGAANVPLLLGLWACQRSLMAVGGPFWGYGWEPQLAELGFHALFLVPLVSLDPICVASPPSTLVLYTIRWHLFRVMMGAGLIKIRSKDIKWKWPHLSAMNYFYETQPVPNPITRYLHWMPKWYHKFEVISNHFVELVAPWMLLSLAPSWRRMGAMIQITFQIILISSGNLSFLNWLTIVPAISCLDDSVVAGLFSNRWKDIALDALNPKMTSGSRNVISILFATWIVYLSIPVVKNLLSKRQIMNGSFGPLRLINTYGAFGVVDEERFEFVVSAATSPDGPWREFEFKVKPSDVKKTPRFISPYHFRLDWQFWLASSADRLEYSPWIYSFLLKLLEQDPDVLSLLDFNPFQDEVDTPKYIRVDKYRYEFNKGKEGNTISSYWMREFVDRIFPLDGVADTESLKEIANL